MQINFVRKPTYLAVCIRCYVVEAESGIPMLIYSCQKWFRSNVDDLINTKYKVTHLLDNNFKS